MHCHLWVPGFDRPQREDAAASPLPASEALQTLLARGRLDRSEASSDPSSWLFGRFGVERQRDWPAAPFRLLGDGGTPGEHEWVCADPVHLRIERNRMVLADSSRFAIGSDEAQRLAADINTHFGERLLVQAGDAQRWYARLPGSIDVQNTPLAAVRGAAADARLPQGPDAMRLQALANELQMLLHDHPVNQEREQRGELPVNGLWLWGAGRLQTPAERPFHFVAAGDPLVQGLAQASGAQIRPSAQSAPQWLAQAGRDEGVCLIVLDALAAPSDYGDDDAWQEALASLERDWFAPLRTALDKHVIGMLTVHLIGRGHMLHAEIIRADLRRFWRRRRPLDAWFARRRANAPVRAEETE